MMIKQRLLSLEQHKKEAQEQGIELIGWECKDPNYRTYRLSCGHIADLQVQHVRRGQINCQVCQEEELRQKCLNAGHEFISLVPRESYSLIVRNLTCGHSGKKARKSTLAHLAGIPCTLCQARDKPTSRFNEFKIKQIEEKRNISVLFVFKPKETSKGVTSFKCIYNDCGHYQDISVNSFLENHFSCRQCIEENWKKEAEIVGLTFLGFPEKKPYDKAMQYKYRLPCGCEKHIRPSHVRENNWVCDKCSTNRYNRPSCVYLMRLSHEGFNWLKLGMSINTSKRFDIYKAKEGVTYEVLARAYLKTARESARVEKGLHRKYKEHKIDKNIAKNYIKNGFTECYPIEMQDTLLKEIQEIYNNHPDAQRRNESKKDSKKEQ